MFITLGPELRTIEYLSHTTRYAVYHMELNRYITKTCPCNINRFFSVAKIENFIDFFFFFFFFFLVFFLFLLKT